MENLTFNILNGNGLSDNKDLLIIIGVVGGIFLIATIIKFVVQFIQKKALKITGRQIIFGIIYVLFILYAMSMIVPFIILVAQSFEDKTMYQILLGEPFQFPKKLIFDNYVFAFQEMQYKDITFFGMIFNSVWYTLIGIAVSAFMNALVGYVVSKYKFKARNIYYGVIIFSMTIPIMGTTGATFKLYSDLNLYDKGPLLQFVANMGAGGMNFLVMYAFFKNVSWEYAEAAFMDGADHFTVFLRIMLPMAKPAMGAIALISGIGLWNEYMNVLMFMPSTPTLASGLYGLSTTLPRLGNTPAYYAALVIALVPILIIFCLFSDKIMQNFSVGGLKG